VKKKKIHSASQQPRRPIKYAIRMVMIIKFQIGGNSETFHGVCMGYTGLAKFILLSNWSLTLRVEHRQRVFKNRMLKRICGPKRDEV
jgi:hypothetical protein